MHDSEYYRKIGFKCGLEIHQRLSTKGKLFCSCCTDSAGDSVIAKISRRQRAVAGELGAIDRSTSFESSRGREFVYNIFKRSSCLVEIDEEPPHHINMSAVESALRLASGFGANVPYEIEPMRKEVVDGSDPSAFQRSMMVGYDGRIVVNGKQIPITSIFLEEESSGIESASEGSVVYNVDRLGIPLIEIDTDPSIATPSEAKNVALEIGRIIRLTGKREGDAVSSEVQRGIGTIRQDVNVSIAGGTRVEIKGLQEIDTVDRIIENEVERQLKLIAIKKELLSNGAEVCKPKDLTKALRRTEAKIVKDALSKGGIVAGARLAKFSGYLGMNINPERRLGSELSDYAKMGGVGGMMHSDEDLSGYGMGKEDIERIWHELDMENGDAFILIAAEKGVCKKAMEFALGRASMALSEVPPETRAVADSKKGTTRFMRPLPGGSRMYPETDTEPVTVDREFYNRIKESTVYMDERAATIRKGLPNAQLADQLVASQRLQLYEYITSKVKGINMAVAVILLEKVKEIERSGITVNTDPQIMLEIFRIYKEGRITKAGIGEIIRELPKGVKDIGVIINKKSLSRISGDQLKRIITNTGGKSREDVMREIMSKYRLIVDGDELKRILGF
ncbi:Glu-tRNA(Gln) amidotransferase subunit GatE [Candidatus Marsarchaeota archaeon]|nr:Glu-tRNA(Gln) amidotransferase subunit GatE [Candidatus Marsarchaeota archaeon]